MQSDMENQAYYIQTLLVDKLNSCKGKENKYTKGHIKEIQDAYKQDNFELKKSVTNNKEQVQEEEVLLYKPYDVDLLRLKTSEPTFIQDKINNLGKYIKFMQTPIKTMPFYPPPHYKAL